MGTVAPLAAVAAVVVNANKQSTINNKASTQPTSPPALALVPAPAPPQDQKPARRPDIDLLRASLVYFILLYHTVEIYIPGFVLWINSRYPLSPALHSALLLFITCAGVWVMPMFFFLAGISAYLALFKRSEQQFRDERVHRLLVPYLFISLFQFVTSIGYFAPNCSDYYFQNETHEMEANAENASRINNCPISKGPSIYPWRFLSIDFSKTFLGEDSERDFSQYIRETQTYPIAGQIWFLVPLFVFSQLFAYHFCLWHPSHSETTASGLPYYIPNYCSRPFSLWAKIFSCMTCLGKPASTAEEFVKSTLWWLGSVFKLGFLPGIFLGLTDALSYLVLTASSKDRWVGVIRFIYYFSYPPILNPRYMWMMLCGYIITAADDQGIRNVLHRGRWIYLFSGILLNIMYSLTNSTSATGLAVPILPIPITEESDFFVLNKIFWYFIRGYSTWPVILGLYGVCRSLVTSSHPILGHLNTISMPFYLIHVQVLIMILTGTLWIPCLGSLPMTILLSTLVLGVLAHLITKMPNFRYFFGLQPEKDSFLPGKKMRGFVPVIVLSLLYVVSYLLTVFL